MSSQQWRQMPIGAEPAPDDNKGVHFRVWAPRRKTVDVVLHDASRDLFIPLAYEGNGYFSALVKQASVGSLYKFRLDHGDSFPDPASRFQPEGVHGWSQVVDSTRFKWTDSDWNGPSKIGNVIYEMHIGTFTKEGTWKAAEKELDSLAELGITVLEVMPIAEFPGAFGWSYDGAYWYAPTRLYGEPDDFRKFVDRAHKLGLAVILDVVYNHFGPDGCYLKEFSKDYFSTKHKSEWGDSPNFDGENCKPARELVVSNVAYWIREFHLDGLRIDVTQSMVDDSDLHILQEMGEAARKAAGKRSTLIVNENEPNNAQLVRPLEQNGMGLDMIWNDDWHHSAKCAATGQDEAYFTDYKGDRKTKRRGTPSWDIKHWKFVHFLENHDQVANSGFGDRLQQETNPAKWRALTALLLLGPQTPMLFQGQEWGSSSPFVYFADHNSELAKLVRKGRLDFMAQFANLALKESVAKLPIPNDPEAFARCRLDRTERDQDPRCQRALQLHRDLILLRKQDRTLCRSQQQRGTIDGAVLAEECFVLRFFGEEAGDDRLLVVNLGRSTHLDPAPEPLLAPSGRPWKMIWSSQDIKYGGIGTLVLDAAEVDRKIPDREVPRPFENWRIQGEIAVLLGPSD